MDKIYCGSGKKIQTQYGEMFNISICLSDIPKEHITEAANGKKYVRMKITERKEADKLGNNMKIEIDTWKPEPKQDQKPVSKQVIEEDDDELPF